MLGFLFGTLCLFGLVKVARGGCEGEWGGGECGPRGFGRHGRCGPPWSRRGCGPGFGHGWHGGRHGHHGHRGHWSRHLLRHLFERLDTTPGQEKVILEAVDGVREAVQKLKGEGEATRAQAARGMRGEHFDASGIRERFAEHDALSSNVREAVVGGLAKIHEALDERQRRELSELIEDGPWGFRHGGRW